MGGEVDRAPAGQRREEGGPAGRVDRTGHADAHGPDVRCGLARLVQAFRENAVQRRKPLTRLRVGGDRAAGGVHHVAVEVGQEHQYLVPAHVDADDVPRPGPEPVPPRRPADDAAAVGLHDGGPTTGDEPLRDDVDGRPGEAGQLGQLGDGGRLLLAERPHHRQRVEFAQPRQVGATEDRIRHAAPPEFCYGVYEVTGNLRCRW
ncbi:hypothetical protein Val02_72910 [Virgisporangium aliadipatigenens]|uniref:Uncharacterized protein n=1 Tax=Virgisporangium aliadipatigenens TaxID=741659 RepID=A0A8J3YV57_9ACTN|nr:hypothetical protein Val02_72910 [Virgisporangium aliadipatigenens]